MAAAFSSRAQILATMALFSVATDAAMGAETRLTVVDSSPTSWVARGYENYTVNADVGWTVVASRTASNVVRLRFDGDPLPGTSVDYWNLEFEAPFGAPLVPGLYEDFQRWPFNDNDRPGLSFSSTGRLDNQASGFFEILDATYGPGTELLSFAANFTHYGETNPNNWAVVEVRYNYVPEPSSGIIAVGAVLVALDAARRSRSW